MGASDLEQLTNMLNDPRQGSIFEQQFGMDISGAKKNDGVVTQYETVSIIATFAEKLVNKGYLNDISASEKKSHEATLKKELGDNVDSYNQLSSNQKDALLIFISTPEAQKQEAIQKAVQGGAVSYAPTDEMGGDSNYVIVDNSGNIINFNPPNIAQTQAYTEIPEIPPFINDSNDLG